MAIRPGESGSSAATTAGVSSLATQGAPGCRNGDPIAANILHVATFGQPFSASDLPCGFSCGVLPDRNLRVVRYSLVCWEMPGLYLSALGGDNHQLLSALVLSLPAAWPGLHPYE